MVLHARSKGEIGSPFNSELVPHLDEIMALIELDLVGDKTSTVLLVGSVLQIPTILVLLDKAAQGLLVLGSNTILNGAPDLQVLGSIAILVLGRALPSDEEGTAGGEANFIDARDRKGEDELTARGIDDADGLGGCPAEETATGRVSTAPEVALGLGEPSEGLVDGRGVKDTDGLLGSVGKLERRRHG